MNAERLLAQYHRIADAPDAIFSLRRFVLDLAVRGKIVPQDPKDEPISVSLKRIVKENKKAKPLPPIEQTVLPFDLPKGWAWERFGNIGETNIGLTYSPQDTSNVGTPVLRSSNIQDGKIDLTDLVRVNYEPKRSVLVQQGDLLICARNGSRALVGKVAIIENLKEPTAFGAFMAVFRSEMNLYLYRFISSPLFRQVIAEVNTTTINQITQNNLRSAIAPLPPLAEQHRIVAKVDELMALCDRLEAARAKREVTRDLFGTATFAPISRPDQKTFQEDVRFALNVLPGLTTRPDQIKQVRQSILNLAVRGKLVPQDPKAESASTLLNRIAIERADLVTRRLLRHDEPQDRIPLHELPFDIPRLWKWSRIGDAVLFTQYGTSQKSLPSEKGIPVLTMGNIQDGMVVWGSEKRIAETSEDLPALFLNKYDILYNRTNSAELVGKTGIYLGEGGVRTFASYLIRLRPSLTWTDPRYLNLAMNTSQFRETQIIPLIKKQTGQGERQWNRVEENADSLTSSCRATSHRR
jgi:type I restriction enzyme S subunit